MSAICLSSGVGRVAAAYVRMSTYNQRVSPEQQRDHVLRLAQRLGFTIAKWYEDHAKSGNDIKRRTEFKQMIADACDGHFHAILVWSLDRFGRFDSIDGAEWVAPLRRARVKLITVAEGEIDWNKSSGRLIYSIQQEGMHTYLVDRARDITRGSHRRAREPGFYPGSIPYGYEKHVFDERGIFQRSVSSSETFCKPKTWTSRLTPIADSSVIKAIRWMFASFARGMTLRGIAHALNARRQPSPFGKHWRQGSVRSILANPVYTGDQVWNRRHSGKYFGVLGNDIVNDAAFANPNDAQRAKSVENSVDNWIVARNDHPSLVGRRMFNRVQALLPARKEYNGVTRANPLAGLVFCAHCGGRMAAQRNGSYTKFAKHVFWRLVCRSATDKGLTVCRQRSIDERLFLAFLAGVLCDRVINQQSDGDLPGRLAAVTSIVDSRKIHPGDFRSRDTRPSKGQNVERLIAETMADVARMRVVLGGSDSELLRSTMQALIARIDLWFGPHPRVSKASKVSRGIIRLRPPFCDLTSGSDAIEFTRSDFESATESLSLMANRKRRPNGQFLPES